MSVEADRARNPKIGSYDVEDTTQKNYCNTYSAKEAGVSTYIEDKSVSKTSYSRPSELSPQYGTEMSAV